MSLRPERIREAKASPREPFEREVANLVREALEAGGVVALPTETVYGLAARADSAAALARLAAIKGLAEKPASPRPWTWHVGANSALELLPASGAKASPAPRAMLRRLAERYWPGPLTLVVPGVPAGLELVARDGWIGVRHPAHVGTASLLAALDFPVVMTSANRSSEPPFASADEIAAALPDVAVVVDGGPSRLGEPSAVLRVGPKSFELLREGLYDLASLQAVAGRRIAFCCTGNTCRSPMAEGLARLAIARRLGVAPAGKKSIERFGFEVASMGIMASYGAPPAPHAVAILAERGGNIAEHVSRPATAAWAASFDLIYGMTAGHVEGLRLALPPQTEVVIEPLDPDGRDIADPLGGSRADYESAAQSIALAIERRLPEWV